MGKPAEFGPRGIYFLFLRGGQRPLAPAKIKVREGREILRGPVTPVAHVKF